MAPERLRIAIVLEATLGGTRKHVVDLLFLLAKKNISPTFIYSLKRADERFKNDIELLKQSGINCVELPMTQSLYNPVNLYCIIKMVILFRFNAIEVIHLHGAVAGALGRLAALFNPGIKKVLYSPHGGVMHKINTSLLSKLFVMIEKVLATKKVIFVAVSSDEKEKVQKYLEIPESRIKLIHNGIDLESFNNSQKYSLSEIFHEKEKLSIDKDDFVLLYPALFLEAKGHSFFFKTLKQKQLKLNPKVKILLAGDGPLRTEVQDLVSNADFQNQVVFLGFVKNIDLYFQLADAIILPSLNEAFGYVLLEAMAYEKPIFATRVGGIKDIVAHNENGFLYELNNLPYMIKDINFYANNRKELNVLGLNSRKLIAKKFSLANTLGKVSDLY